MSACTTHHLENDGVKVVLSRRLLYEKRYKYPYLGTWKITKCEALSDPTGIPIQKIEGSIFTLEPSQPLVDASGSLVKQRRVRRPPHKATHLMSTSSDDSNASETSQTESSSSDDDDSDDSDSLSRITLGGGSRLHASAKEYSASGDVIWQRVEHNNYDDDDEMPFINCRLFEFETKQEARILRMIGSVSSSNFDFKLSFVSEHTNDLDDDDDSVIILELEDMLKLTCQRLMIDENYDNEYNFLNVFNNDFLADVQIKAANGQTFYAHKQILWLTFEDKTDALLAKLREYNCDADLIELILFYCYCDCLPTSHASETDRVPGASAMHQRDLMSEIALNEAKCKLYLEFTQNFTELRSLYGLLKSYLSNTTFKSQTDKILEEVKECVVNVNVFFKCDELPESGSLTKSFAASTHTTSTPSLMHLDADIFTQPAKFCAAVKQSFEQLCLACVKFARLLDLFCAKQEQLSRDERNEFVKKVKYSIPFFLKQLQRFLKSIYKQAVQLNEAQKRDLADYLLPEIDNLVNFCLQFNVNVQAIIEHMVNIRHSEPSDENGEPDAASDSSCDDHDYFDASRARRQKSANKKKKNIKNIIGKSIKNTIHLRELKRLQKMGEKGKKNFLIFEKKLQKYQMCNDVDRANIIHKDVDEFIDNMKGEIPRLLRKLDNYSLDRVIKTNRVLKLSDFKFSFKLVASKTSWVLNQIRANKRTINPLFNDICSKLHSDQLKRELENLYVAEKSGTLDSAVEQSSLTDSNNNTLKVTELPCHLDSFYKSQSAYNNRLAQQAVRLYCTKELSDVELEVHDESDQVTRIRIHGALVASRCAWFQRALNSGMKEAIDKKMTLHDSNLSLFNSFIKYLYVGALDEVTFPLLSAVEVVEFLTLADKYECYSLQKLLEIKILDSIRNHGEFPNEANLSAFLFDYLSLSEQFHLDTLKDYCSHLLVRHCGNLSELLSEHQDENPEQQLSDVLVAQLRAKHAKKCKSEAQLFAANSGNAITSFMKRHRRKHAAAARHRTTADLIMSSRRTSSSSTGSSNRDDVSLNISMPILVSRMDELRQLAHPLIVLDGHLLEQSYNQLREIVGTHGNPLNEEELVKLLITNDCDLNRVIPIVLNFD